MDSIALLQQQPREVCAILARYARDQCSLQNRFLPKVGYQLVAVTRDALSYLVSSALRW